MSLTELTGVFSWYALPTEYVGIRPVAFPRHQLLTLRQTPRAGDGKERRTRQARARKNVTCSTFFPDPANMLDYPDTCQVTKGKAAGQMRNSLLRKQRNRGALQEQVSPEFSSMICVLLSFKFRFKARLRGLRTQTVKLGKNGPRVHRGHSSADKMEVRSNLRVCLVQNLASSLQL